MVENPHLNVGPSLLPPVIIQNDSIKIIPSSSRRSTYRTTPTLESSKFPETYFPLLAILPLTGKN